MRTLSAGPFAAVAVAVMLSACSASSKASSTLAPTTRTVPRVAATTTTREPSSTTAVPTSAPPATSPTTTLAPTTAPTTTTPTTAVAPPFSATVAPVTAAELGASYHAGCPVGPAELRTLHLEYWGFDDRAHAGAMVVNAAVTSTVVSVFDRLYRAHFPIRRMVPVVAFGGSDPASMAADNTSGFNCRPIADSNPPRWSAHAYGEAIDVNTVENPYLPGGTVEPPAGAAYLDRGDLRPGMAAPGTALNDAFAAVGWPWGGRWTRGTDYQHFSKTGG